MSISHRAPARHDEFVWQMDLIRLITAACPVASVLDPLNGLLSADFAGPTLEASADGLALSFPIGAVPFIKASTVIVWTVSFAIPEWILPISPHLDTSLGHLYVSLRCSAIDPSTNGLYLARRVVIESNLRHVGNPDFQRIVQWLSQCDDPFRLVVGDVFRAWKRCSLAVH
jgi:hypothetical protein